jgi:deoxyguanosine kinase
MNFISIEGNIGAGKTTLAKNIAQHFKYEFLPEEFEKNSLLPLFYNQPDEFAFTLEFSFLIDRFQQLLNWRTIIDNNNVVSDYHFHKCLCFAKVNLIQEEYELFEKEFYKLNDIVSKPNLIVLLKLDSTRLIQNIGKRNRNSEKLISTNYLEKVSKNYQVIFTEKLSTPIIEFHLNENHEKTYQQILHEVISIVESGNFNPQTFNF